ncbi:uncharacterized mitochondrial protein AtMg00860-like [Phragmites australis]|uniref:uncharacterized mitochondrial protein AtMg00860-like n=1 Tax=Phragmites australis TaxID=29695 RepID=UPI002D78F7E2|nr:uncharacterized mitochondrial protein AtMg00860-like [Phragmites australis]
MAMQELELLAAQSTSIEPLMRWKPEMEAFMAELRTEMSNLQKQVRRIACNPVYSPTLEQHERLLKQVFEILMEHQLKVKLSTCLFVQKQLVYLGHVIGGGKVAIDEKNIRTVKNRPVPTSVIEVRGFLGLVGYYYKLVQHFREINCPLTELLKKN